MIISSHLAGGASLLKKLKLGAAVANPGTPVMGGAGTSLGVIPVTATSFINAYGLGLDPGTYSTTQGAVEGIVTVDVRPDLVVRARISGGATEGTAILTVTNTSASAGGTVVTATVGTHDIDGGTAFCISGNNVGLSRSITAYSSNASCTVTVPFPRAIAVGDQFIVVPWNMHGTGADGADGCGFLQTTTVFTEARQDIASGTGGEVSITDMELKESGDSYVYFVFRDHVHNSAALAS
jgi:hypothetical protein